MASASEDNGGGEELEFDDFDLEEIERHLKVLERTLPVERGAYDAVRAHLERAAFPRFVAYLGPRGIPTGKDVQRRLEDDARAIVSEVCKSWTPKPTAEDMEYVARRIALDILGTGPLQEFLDDPSVTEIMVNGPFQIVVERGGKLVPTDVSFRDEQHLTNTIRKMAERIERRIDYSSPTLDGRLPDGSRIHAILPPIALDGPQLTIRKFGKNYTQIEDLIQIGTLRPEMAFYLGACVKARLNIAIGGPSASGKTTTLNVLATQVPPHERLVTIEELAELDFSESHCHVVRLQARPENIDGAGVMTIRQLVREALRMRADRVVVGEARGGEMIDVLQAMRCGHDGSMTTIHASTREDVIERAVTIGLFSEVPISETNLRRMVVDSLDVIVVLARFANGDRKVVNITEPYMSPSGEVRFNDVFAFEHTGYAKDDSPLGTFRWVGPTRHGSRFRQMGISVPEAALGELR